MLIYYVITPQELICQSKNHQIWKPYDVFIKTTYSFVCFKFFAMLLISVTTTNLTKAHQKRNGKRLISLVFSKFSKLPSSLRDSGNFLKTLKIRVKVILNCPWAHAITYTTGKQHDNMECIKWIKTQTLKAVQVLHSSGCLFAGCLLYHFQNSSVSP